MTKENVTRTKLIGFTIALMAFHYYFGDKMEAPKETTSPQKVEIKEIIEEKAEPIQDRIPGSVPQIKNTKKASPLDKEWKKKLANTILTQGGTSLKRAEIHRIDSFNWKFGQVDIPVESVMVKLEHVKGHTSSFRAIIDSSNGKILQTWDPPVVDKFGSKESEGVKIDPRYFNQ